MSLLRFYVSLNRILDAVEFNQEGNIKRELK